MLKESTKTDRVPQSRRGGFTIVELLITLVIIAILAAISVPTYRHFIRKAEAAGCMNNIKQLWTAANAYMKDQPKERRHWPQVPESVLAGDGEDQFWKFWIESLEPYGATQEVWLCPTDKRSLNLSGRGEDEYAGSYIPTLFDEREYTPFRWSQPWFAERANFHGKGAHIIMSKGDIQESAASFTLPLE